MSAELTHPEIEEERLNSLAEDAVQIEPVSAPKFPSIRENNREFCGSDGL